MFSPPRSAQTTVKDGMRGEEVGTNDKTAVSVLVKDANHLNQHRDRGNSETDVDLKAPSKEHHTA